jgi:hypothetical protein
MITHERLLSLLSYDEETGIFRWCVSRGQARAGDEAGVMLDAGYIQIMIDYEHYSAHQLAWFYVSGEWPDRDVDHKDTVKNHNAIANLRLATEQQNRYNTPKLPGTSSKWKGVTYDPGRKKCWKMSFKMPDGARLQRRYEDEREAAEEYMFLALEHHGECARFD